MKKEELGLLESGFTPVLAMEEASRCLLCMDAPCSKNCPAGTDPARFIRSIRFKNVKGAASTIRKNNPFGAVCAFVCPTEHYCQLGCSRSGIDRPIQIAKLQRYALESTSRMRFEGPKLAEPNGKRIAIVGSGPSGLTAASKLAELGYEVDVFEKEAKPGGYLRYGIPSYRLPVRIHCGVRIGEEKTLASLQNQYDAVIVATGHDKPKMLPMFEGNKRCISAVEFLKKVKTGKIRGLPDHVLVIGGGDVAMDVIATCKKLGVEQVSCAVYERFCEFKASKAELETVRSVQASIYDGFVPTEVKRGGTVVFRHRFKDIEIRLKAGLIVLAIGQYPDFAAVGIEGNGLEAKAVDQRIGENLFVCGDIACGDKTVVYGVRTGKQAAMQVHAYLGGKQQ